MIFNVKNVSNIDLGNLRNTIGSLSRKYKNCNKNNDSAFNCIFDISNKNNDNDNGDNIEFTNYHILNDTEIDLELIQSDTNENNNKKAISYGPYSPIKIKTAYNIKNILPLSGKRTPIITIISAFNNPYLVNDVKKFGQLFGLPPCNLKVYNFSRYFSVGWAIETTLDVQWAYAINPYAEIRVILAASANTVDIFNAINYANNKNNFKPAINTDIISLSFGASENSNLIKYGNYFSNTNTIYLCASGDRNNVSFPSTCSNIIAVGGTTLGLNSDNTRAIEETWSLTGCGYSKYFNKPYYQPNLFNNNFKITPDLCCVADPNTPCYIVLNSKVYTIGGTSISCPIYAGIISIITQKLINENKRTFTSVQNCQNSIQPILYNLINTFYDVTQGNSGTNQAKSGFDSASGLGVIDIDKICANL